MAATICSRCSIAGVLLSDLTKTIYMYCYESSELVVFLAEITLIGHFFRIIPAYSKTVNKNTKGLPRKDLCYITIGFPDIICVRV